MPVPFRRPEAAILALVLLAAASAAMAAPAPRAAATVTGLWAFETDRYAEGCKLTGDVTLKGGPDGFTCRLRAVETCPGFLASAEQTCTATRKGDALTIKSEVVRVAPPSTSYVPDDFELTIESGARMKGWLRSYNSAPARFWRPRAALVS